MYVLYEQFIKNTLIVTIKKEYERRKITDFTQ